MKVKVSEIKVFERIRKDPGDLSGLKDSIKMVGLLNPIIIDLNSNLVSGYRRLEAVRELGWEYIEARIIDIRSKRQRILIESEENSHRIDLNEIEIERFQELSRKYAGTGLTHWLNYWADKLVGEMRRKGK